MMSNETCNNSADCLEGLICVKQICLDAPVQVNKIPKRHSKVFHDKPQSLCVLPLMMSSARDIDTEKKLRHLVSGVDALSVYDPADGIRFLLFENSSIQISTVRHISILF
ncbi:hypothetical protein CRE_00567 [Caenorhabditis remanei]|uniref:Uncharacterized protein n=2 Tax=Caenorhabditis remanei TaxID=31234 RepID=E3LD55_CAERE|nr:hypothetical protein CRE_00567 [Caenorhabditis remanei]